MGKGEVAMNKRQAKKMRKKYAIYPTYPVLDEFHRVFSVNTKPFELEAQQHKTVTIEQSLDKLKGKYANA